MRLKSGGDGQDWPCRDRLSDGGCVESSTSSSCQSLSRTACRDLYCSIARVLKHEAFLSASLEHMPAGTRLLNIDIALTLDMTLSFDRAPF